MTRHVASLVDGSLLVALLSATMRLHRSLNGCSRFRPVLFPDPGGREVLARAMGRLSFQEGEFSATYGTVGGPFEGAFDAIVTSFFIDTAPNVVEVSARLRSSMRLGLSM